MLAWNNKEKTKWKHAIEDDREEEDKAKYTLRTKKRKLKEK
jgi:hypothetical protein